MKCSIVLASASPRRQELLRLFVEDFAVEVSGVEEVTPDDLPLDAAPEFLARLKAEDVAARHPDQLVIGSDTGVFVEDGGQLRMLGKPTDDADAAAMLRMLSGKRHFVRTGCCLCYHGHSRSFTEQAEVEFYPLTEQEIQDYIATKEPQDKAGAYGIQGYGALLVKGISGDFYTIMGLPVARLKREIENWLAEGN